MRLWPQRPSWGVRGWNHFVFKRTSVQVQSGWELPEISFSPQRQSQELYCQVFVQDELEVQLQKKYSVFGRVLSGFLHVQKHQLSGKHGGNFSRSGVSPPCHEIRRNLSTFAQVMDSEFRTNQKDLDVRSGYSQNSWLQAKFAVYSLFWAIFSKKICLNWQIQEPQRKPLSWRTENQLDLWLVSLWR